jgi:hypothetical protein
MKRRPLSVGFDNKSIDKTTADKPLSRPASVKVVAAAIPESSSRIGPIFVERQRYGAILDVVDGTTDPKISRTRHD